MIDIQALLRGMMEKNASDLHMRVGGPPVYRVNGQLYRLNMDRLSAEDMDQVFSDLANEHQRQHFVDTFELDMSVGLSGVGRFRVNAFRQRGTISLAIRSIKTDVPRFEALNLPEIILDIAMRKRGLVLV
ncbi:MAG: type IV pili twitching motility protein PilT, partial [Chitinivibrionales bacterium]|nr:type IV pili twitching motility protein PilT [Chitinivibrionales bacterium]